MGVLLCMRVYTKYANEESAACKRQTGQTADNPHSQGNFPSLQWKWREENQHVFFPGRWNTLWIFIKPLFSHGSVNGLQFMKLWPHLLLPLQKKNKEPTTHTTSKGGHNGMNWRERFIPKPGRSVREKGKKKKSQRERSIQLNFFLDYCNCKEKWKFQDHWIMLSDI